MRVLKKIVVHCSDTPATLDIGVKEITAWHTAKPPKGNGWRDIGYHFVIRRGGTVEPGRPVSAQGAHVAGHNADSIGVCLVGGKWDADYEPQQYEALAVLLRSLMTNHGPLEVVGHRDLDRLKSCPRFDVKAWWKAQ